MRCAVCGKVIGALAGNFVVPFHYGGNGKPGTGSGNPPKK